MGSCFPSPRQEGVRGRCWRIVKRARRIEGAGNATLRAVLRAHPPRFAPLALPGSAARHPPCRVTSQDRPMGTIRLIHTTRSSAAPNRKDQLPYCRN